MATGTQNKTASVVLNVVSPKKGSVRFDADPGEQDPVVNAIYLERKAAAKHFGISDLNKVAGIKVTVEVL